MVRVKRRPDNLLVFQVNGLGNFICLLPTLGGLRSLLPGARITLLTSPAGEAVVRSTGLVDEVIVQTPADLRALRRRPFALYRQAAALRRRGFDATLSVEDEGSTSAWLARFTGAPVRIGFRSTVNRHACFNHRLVFDPSRHIVENRYRMLAVLAQAFGLAPPWPPLRRWPIPVTEADRRNPRRIVDSLGTPRVAVIHPFAAHAYQEWPLERYLDLAGRLTATEPELGCLVLTDGRSVLPPVAPRVRLVSLTSVRELIALITRADIFIGNNSGPMHVAAAQGTPILWIHGCTPPVWFPFWRDAPVRRISVGVSCQPCDTWNVVHGACPDRREPMVCLKAVSVETVLETARTWLRTGGGERQEGAAATAVTADGEVYRGTAIPVAVDSARDGGECVGGGMAR